MISRQIRRQLCVLALIYSIIEQMRVRSTEYTDKTRFILNKLASAHEESRRITLSCSSIAQTSDGKMLFDNVKQYGRWLRVESKFHKAVMEGIEHAKIADEYASEHRIDATAWLTAIMLIVAELRSQVPHTQATFTLRVRWNYIENLLTELYEQFDPELECQKQMEQGTFCAKTILESID